MTPLGALPRLSSAARRALVVSGLLSAGNAVALVVQAWALGTALARVVTEGVQPAELSRHLVVLAAAVLARAVLGWATEAVSARAAAGAKEELRALLLDSALRRGPEWIQQRGAAELTTIATKGLDSLDAYFTKYLPALVTAGVVPPLVGAWILFSDWPSAVTILLTVPLIPLFAWLVGKYTEQRTAKATDAVQRLSGQLLELIRALPVLTAFGRARAQGQVVQRVSDDHRRAAIATLRIAFLSALVLELLSSLSVALVAVSIGLRLVEGNLTLATGLVVLILAPECYLPLRAAGAAHHASEDGVEAVRRVDEIVREAEQTRRSGAEPAEPAEVVLEVEQLRVRRREKCAPDGLTFTARPGEIVRLEGFNGIGPSGSGKSTTFSVLLGFTAPESGQVRCGGTDISRFDPASWRRLIAWVPQRPAFTGGTVREELLVALADQPPVPEAAIDEVLAEVGAAHLRDRRIDGLSTGERQRVAVARALLRLRGAAKLLLLDEPTAHLDPATAHRVNTAVERAAAAGATVVLASHRPQDAEPRPGPAVADAVGELQEQTGAGTRIRDLLDWRAWSGIGLGALSLLSGLALTAVAAWLIAKASQQPPVLSLTVAAVGVRTFALSRAVLRYLERLVTHDAAFRNSTALRGRLWNALLRLGPVRAAGLRRGEGIARLVDDVDAIRDLVPRVLFPPVVAAVVVLAAIVVQTAVLPEAGLVLAAALVAAGLLSPLAAVVAERRATAAVAEGRRRVAADVFALLDGAAELLAFGAHRAHRDRLAAADRELAGRARRAASGAGVASAVIVLCTGLAVLGSTYLGAAAVAEGRLAPPMAAVLGLVPLAAAEAVALLPPAAQQWRSLRAAQARLAPLLATPEPEPPRRTPADGIELRGVRAQWPGTARAVLQDVDLHVPAGTHVAVVGPSGSGKSTLLALLLGFVPPERGEVRVPERVAWCPQEPQLVATTVRENLRVADPKATDEQLAEALELAGLPHWADRLDTVVGPAGAAVSGGEAQRLALARALLVPDARLVLLDEPTAHLDEPTARALLSRLRERLRDRTVVHVTHRWSETAHADVVVQVSDGSVTVLRQPSAPDGGGEVPTSANHVVSAGMQRADR